MPPILSSMSPVPSPPSPLPTGDRVHHADVSEFARKDDSHPGFLRVLRFEELLILFRAEIACERIHRFQQAVHGAERHILDIWLLDVFAFDPRKDLGIDGKLAVGFFRRRALSHDSAKQKQIRRETSMMLRLQA